MSVNPNDPRLRAAAEAYHRGDLNRSATILAALLAEHPTDINLLQNLGTLDAQRGKLDLAVSHFERARSIDPKNVQTLSALGFVFKTQKKLNKAEECFQAAIAVNPKMIEAHLNLGDLYMTRGDVDAARRCFEKVISIKPDLVDALVSLASLHEGEHRLDEARSYAERAVKLAPSHGHANIMLAQIELRSGQTELAAQQLERLLKISSIKPFERALAQYLVGKAADKLGDYDKAFAACEAGNTGFYNLYKASTASMSSVLAPKSLDEIHAFFSDEDISGWSQPETLEGPAPVFLVGFPRSGTTLLDQMLKAHSAIKTLEEKETLIDARNDLMQPSGALKKLRKMTEGEINDYRKQYWARVREDLSDENAGGVIIDKMPLNTILLGLIYRLFPDAKIIFALRDPRDVVLSCFQQRFGMNAAMFQFLKLETTAAYYDQVMKLADLYRARLPLNLHIIRYEDLVGDMQRRLLNCWPSWVLSGKRTYWITGNRRVSAGFPRQAASKLFSRFMRLQLANGGAIAATWNRCCLRLSPGSKNTATSLPKHIFGRLCAQETRAHSSALIATAWL